MATQTEIATILKSPTLFAIKFLNIEPFEYQAEILEDEHPRMLIVGGRQIGKSLTLAIKALWNAFVKPNQDILIIAPTQRQSQVIYDKIFDIIYKNDFIRSYTTKFTLSETKFQNGSVIRCLTSGLTGEYVRGYAATMIIYDEAAFIPDEVFIALEPSLAVKGRQAIMSSTPYGKRGTFWNIYSHEIANRTNLWNIYKIKSIQNPLITKEFLEMARNSRTPVQFAQEFEGEFIDDTGLFFPFNLVLACAKDYNYSFPLTKSLDDRWILGVDVARMGMDETAFVVVEKSQDGSRKVIWSETRSNTKITDVAARIRDILSGHDIDIVYIDKSGVGAGVLDVLESMDITDRIKGVEFSPTIREEIYSALKISMERGSLILNANDNKFLYQFNSFTASYGKDSKLRIVKSNDIHDDLVDALAITFRDDDVFTVSVFNEINELLDKQGREIQNVRDGNWSVIGNGDII